MSDAPTPPVATTPLRVTAVEIDGTVTRPLRWEHGPGETLLGAVREAMLKRGCLREREHKGECLSCALLPQCAVWPLVAPADPTRRQRGVYLRPYVMRVPEAPSGDLPVGTRITYGMTFVQDTGFPNLWGEFAGTFVRSARQIAEWGIGTPVPMPEGPARRGAISVGRARWLNPVTGESQPLILPESGPPVPPIAYAGGTGGIVLPASIATGRLALTFLTPTRLIIAGDTLREPAPQVLVQRILERLESVAAAVEATFPYAIRPDAALASAGRLRLTSVAMHWEGSPERGGFVGTAALVGTPDDLTMVLRVLHWGQTLGVGKGTQQGAGRFVLDPVPPTARVELPNPTDPRPRSPRKAPWQRKS